MKATVYLILFLVIMAIIPLPLMWLWNGMLPDMFGFPEIGYWRAVGLLLLSSILFNRIGTKYNTDSNG